MKTKLFDGLGLNTLLVAVVAAFVLSGFFVSCDTQLDDILNEGTITTDTTRIKEGFHTNQSWYPQRDGLHTINTRIVVTGNCYVDGKADQAQSSQTSVNVEARVEFNPNYILFSENGKMPVLQTKRGADRTNADEIANTDTCQLGDFRVLSHLNRKYARLNDCELNDVEVLAGYVPVSEFASKLGEFQKDTTIGRKIYSLYFATVSDTIRNTYKKEYDADFLCDFRVAMPRGTVPDTITYVIRNIRPTAANASDITVSYDRVKLENGTEVDTKTIDNKLSWSILAADTTFTVPAWPTVEKLTAEAKGFTYITKTNVANRNFVVKVSSKTVIDEVTKEEVALSVESSEFEFTDKGITPVADLSMEGNFERKSYTSSIEVKILDFIAPKASVVTMKKEKAADIIKYLIRNIRPTAVTATDITMSYDRVKLVNDAEIDTAKVDNKLPWSVITSDTTVTVLTWPTVERQKASKSGYTCTTKTNVANRNFTVKVSPKTVIDEVTKEKVNLSVDAENFTFLDKGISAVTDLPMEGNFERKTYSSNIEVKILDFTAPKTSNVIIKKEKAVDVIKYLIRNIRPTAANATDITVSYDRVKMVNDAETETTKVDNLLPWSVFATDTAFVVTAWPTVEKLTATKSGYVCTTKTNVANRNFTVKVSSKTVVDEITKESVVLSVDANNFTFVDKGISPLADISPEGNFERKSYTSSIEVKVLDFTAPKTSTVTLKKEKAADVIKYLIRNIRPTSADASNVTVSYDRVKLVNNAEVETKTIDNKLPWSINATDTIIPVTSWPIVNKLTATKNGYIYTTKTNVTNRNFTVKISPKTVVDEVTKENVTLSVDASEFSFTDKGISALTDLSQEGNYERKAYTSSIEVKVLDFTAPKMSKVTLRKEKPADVITYKDRNHKITNVTASTYTPSFEWVKYVNGNEDSFQTISKTFGWSVTAPAQQEKTVTTWPSITSSKADLGSWSGSNRTVTTKTNVFNFGFQIFVESGSWTGNGSTVNFKSLKDEMSITDLGASELKSLSTEGGFERQSFTSSIEVMAQSLPVTSVATGLLKKAVVVDENDDDDQTKKFAGFSIFFDNTANTTPMVSAVMIYNAGKSGSLGGIRAAHNGTLLNTTWDWTKVLKPEELPAGCKYAVIIVNNTPTPAYMDEKSTSTSLVWKSALRSNSGTKIYSITRSQATKKGFFNGDIAITEGVNLVNGEWLMTGHYSKTTDEKAKDYDVSATFPKAW